MNPTWKKLKRVREEEHFVREENQKLQEFKDELSLKADQKEDDLNIFSSFQKGLSPLTGAPLFKMVVAGAEVIDCPDERAVTMSYHTLHEIIQSLQEGEASAINAWKTFITENNIDADEQHPKNAN